MTDVKLEGVDELRKLMKALPKRMEKNVLRTALRGSAAVVRDEARNNVPPNMTTLRKAITIQSSRGTRGIVRLKVGWTKGRNARYDAWYGHFFEQGADPHDISPRTGEALRFSVGGQVVFRPVVKRHPGIPAIHFLQRGFDSTQNKQIEAFKDKAWAGLVKQIKRLTK